jgi:phage-related protein
MKIIAFAGSSLNDIKNFPDIVKKRIGYQLHRVQVGENPNDWKPMKGIGKGVKEIRIKVENQYRVIYIDVLAYKIYVLHAFIKKSQKTSKRDLEIARHRLKEIQKIKGGDNG